MEIYIDDEAKKLIEELCNKEIKRTGLPLEYDERRTKISGDALFFHQKIKFKIKDCDSVVLENQNDLSFKNGKFEYDNPYDEFYAYVLVVEQKKSKFYIHLDNDNLPTESEIIEKVASDKFKEDFDEYKRMRNKLNETLKDMQELEDKTANYLGKAV